MSGHNAKKLGFIELVSYGLCMISPLALFLVYGSVSQESYGMTPLVYALGTTLMLFIAFSYSQFSKEFPSSGSVYTYISKGVNSHIGFVGGWSILGYYLMGPGFLYSLTGVFMSELVPNVQPIVWVIILAILNTLINIRGVELGARVNLVLLTIQLLAILTFFGLAIKYVFIDGNGTGGFSLAPLFQPENISLEFITVSVSIAILGFLGIDGLSTLAEESKNPRRNIGLAMITTLILIGSIFMIQGYVSALAHPNYADLDPDMALFQIASEIGGDTFMTALIVITVLAFGLSAALSMQSAVSRVLFAMSRDKMLPKFFSKTHKTYNTPINTIIFMGILSIGVAYLVSPSVLMLFINFGAITAYMLLNLAVIIYFFIKQKRKNNLKEVFSYLIFPLIGFGACLLTWTGFDKQTLIAGFSWLAVGVTIGAIASKGYKVTPKLEEL